MFNNFIEFPQRMQFHAVSPETQPALWRLPTSLFKSTDMEMKLWVFQNSSRTCSTILSAYLHQVLAHCKSPSMVQTTFSTVYHFRLSSELCKFIPFPSQKILKQKCFPSGFTKDVKNSKFEIYGRIPRMVVRGDYNAKAKLFFSTIEGNGSYVVVLEDIKGSIKFKPTVRKVENGKTFVRVDKLKVLLEPKM